MTAANSTVKATAVSSTRPVRSYMPVCFTLGKISEPKEQLQERLKPPCDFPHDEFDDVGLREAILEVSKEAPKGAFLGGEAPPVFHYYLRRFDREDLRTFRLSEHLPDRSNPGLMLVRASLDASVARTVPVYAIVQEGREYFDNISAIRTLESQRKPASMVLVDGVSAATIYRFDNLRPSVGPNQLSPKAESHGTDIVLSKTGVPFPREKLPGS